MLLVKVRGKDDTLTPKELMGIVFFLADSDIFIDPIHLQFTLSTHTALYRQTSSLQSGPTDFNNKNT